MLYLVSTPIGNLADFSFRAVEVLKHCDEILCEDTRHSKKLLDHYQIKTPTRSYHRFNEAKCLDGLLDRLGSGHSFALISDAGTPGISDPGERLVSSCIERKLPITTIPGPCALIQALIASGLPTIPFQFCGFIPRKAGERRLFLAKTLFYQGSTLLYESPRRIEETLKLLAAMAPLRSCCLARELTKQFEEYIRLPANQLYQNLQQRDTIRGELVLVIAPPSNDERTEEADPLALLTDLQTTFDLPKKEALKLAAELLGLPKRTLYRHRLDNEDLPTET